MSMDKDTKNEGLTGKNAVRSYFREHSLSPAAKQRLLEKLATAESPAAVTQQPSWMKRHKAAIVSSMVSALLAASLTLIIVDSPSEPQSDPIAELAQLPAGHRLYPPDFDLDGDSANLNEIVHDIFADNQFFVSDLPPQVVAEYAPATGRFFSWDGEPAVSIDLNKSNVNVASNPSATLFIVKLSEKSKKKFPKEKQTRKVTGKTGKLRKVKVWREGNFGYAMLQEPAINTP